MTDYVIPDPEPKEIDEKLSLELRYLAQNAVLKGKPSGDEKCETCVYYLENTADLSYCWRNSQELWMRFWRGDPPDFLVGGHLLLFGADAGWASWSGVSRSATAIGSSQHGHRPPGPSRRHHVLHSSQRCWAR